MATKPTPGTYIVTLLVYKGTRATRSTAKKNKPNIGDIRKALIASAKASPDGAADFSAILDYEGGSLGAVMLSLHPDTDKLVATTLDGKGFEVTLYHERKKLMMSVS